MHKKRVSLTSNLDLMAKDYDPRLRIERCEFPNIQAIHFVVHGLLGTGVSSTSSPDALGKVSFPHLPHFLHLLTSPGSCGVPPSTPHRCAEIIPDSQKSAQAIVEKCWVKLHSLHTICHSICSSPFFDFLICYVGQAERSGYLV